jgi:transcriptional regulator with XRE-family HTH domain
MEITIGSILKQTRQSQHLTQKAVADGICSQAMLSSLENDKYIPNAQLVIALCQRLSISLDRLTLAENYAISNDDNLNQELDRLCNQHQYQHLFELLHQKTTLNALITPAQTQSYYYYLAIAEFQIDVDTTNAIQHLKLALASSSSTPSILDRLCLGTLGLILNLHTAPSGDKYLQQSFADIKSAVYHPNLNILFYLQAFNAYRQQDFLECTHAIENGLNFITNHDSHYMLANLYYLLAKVASQTNDLNLQSEAAQRSKIFAELFSEHPYQDFKI